ncbi:MAG: RecQ family zinc-binding domain-containing protein, partial [Planctomycetales bacterium]|nr:RecQ family zinc-binding domain-containing protein [Planctomycetales bacterium]
IQSQLRELAQLKSFEYVPPFRGRAIHVPADRLPFDQLQIDFASLEERRKLDYMKLRRMVRFAETSGCRQLEMLDYFGDPDTRPCGNCDNCRQGAGHQGKPNDVRVDVQADAAVRHVVRVALSGVARGHQRYGQRLVAAMLAGSQSAKVSKAKLDRLSTFGLLGQLLQSDVNSLLSAMVHGRLLEKNEVDRFRPILKLTEPGLAVMRGESDPEGATPRPSLYLSPGLLGKIRSYYAQAADPVDPSNAVRPSPRQPDQVAASSADSQATERDASATQIDADWPAPSAPNGPSDRVQESTAAWDVPAESDSADKRGGDCRPHPAHALPSPQGSTLRGTKANCSSAQPDCYWTWRLLADGYDVSACRQIRHLSEGEILDHLVQAAQQGWTVELSWILSAEQQRELLTVIADVPRSRLLGAANQLSAGLGLEHLLLAQACAERNH